jgi:hypothetical protein
MKNIQVIDGAVNSVLSKWNLPTTDLMPGARHWPWEGLIA